MLFLDFETNIAGHYYLAGISSGSDVKQVILDERLKGLATHHKMDITTPFSFTYDLLKQSQEEKRLIVGYSTAEKNYINALMSNEIHNFKSVEYLNIRKAAVKWVNKYQRDKFEKLPPLVITARDYEQRRHKKSLASIARLINYPAPKDYAIGKTTKRINEVIAALELRKQDYKLLTSVQKAKATRALKHNYFDVEAMVLLCNRIKEDDNRLLTTSITPLFDI